MRSVLEKKFVHYSLCEPKTHEASCFLFWLWQVLHVSALQCVGYDTQWQASLIQRYTALNGVQTERQTRRRTDASVTSSQSSRQGHPSSRQPEASTSSLTSASSRDNLMAKKRRLKAAGLASDESELSDLTGAESVDENCDEADEAEVEAML